MSDSIPEGWSFEPIGDSISLLTDYTANGSFAALKENITYYNSLNYAALVRTTDLEKRDFIPERFTDKRGFDFLKKSELFPGDIVIANVGSAGKAYKVPMYYRPMTLAPNMYLIKFSDKLNDDFAFQVITSDRFQIKLLESCANTTLKAINKTAFRSIEIGRPPIIEQKKIATILSSVDEVIEKTRAQIEKLKDLKTGMMQELLTKGIGHTEFKDSTVGRIPAAWRVATVGELFDIQLGKMLSKASKLTDSPYLYLGNKNVQWGRFRLDNLEAMDFSERERKKFELRHGDLLMCEGGDVGRCAIWQGELQQCYYQKALHRLRPKNGEYSPMFLLEYIKFSKIRGLLTEFISQTSIAHLTREKLTRIPVPVPPRPEQAKIDRCASSIDARMDRSIEKLSYTQSLKKALMQDLLTGKVRVNVNQEEAVTA